MTKNEFEKYIAEVESRLLPCPCCGCKAKYINSLNITPVIGEDGAYVDADLYYFERTWCPECGLEVSSDDDNEPEEITVEKWNKRCEQKTPWIPCVVGLPKLDTRVLIAYSTGKVFIGSLTRYGANGLDYWDIPGQGFISASSDVVREWLPLPEVPEKYE